MTGLEALYEEHPLLPLPTKQQAMALVAAKGDQALKDLLINRRKVIDGERQNPFINVYENFAWKEATAQLKECDELLVLGGNRSGKTQWAGKTVMDVIARGNDKIAWCLHTTATSAVEMQHPVLYKYIPMQFKAAAKSKITNVTFSMKNGFADDKFIFPNGSQCIFKNYSQDIKVIEGGEPDIIWCDELVPMNWIETLRYRLITRRGKLLITFTPIYGLNAVVKDYVSGGRLMKSMPLDYIQPELAVSRRASALLPMNQVHAQGCPPGHMPYILQSRRPVARVVYFFTQWNPYSPYNEMVKKCRGESSVEIKKRAFGYCENLVGSQFPKFSDEVNVVKHDKIPTQGTNYMVLDPAGARNWFMLWARVVPGPDKRPQIFIYREWPDSSYGEWTLPCEKPDGKRGPAQTQGSGMGIRDYKKTIINAEGPEKIFTRYIDPKAGNAAVIAEDQGTSIIDMLSEDNRDSDGSTIPGMVFVPSVGKLLEESISMINNWLSYNQNQPITALNQPQLYISERCPNLIYSMKEWTGLDGDKGASKDPIDCLRYLAVEDIDYVPDNIRLCTQPRSY